MYVSCINIQTACMQEDSPRRSNRLRTKTTRAALTKAARQLFVTKGYAHTGTPEIVAAAKVTRGALYHHFDDKLDLFRAVVTIEAGEVADKIQLDSAESVTMFESLMAGCDAYFDAMAVPGRTRLLLVDGPSILGHEEMERINSKTAGAKLYQGLNLVFGEKHFPPELLDPLTEVLSACFDRAALEIAQGKPAKSYRDAIGLLLERFR